MINAILNFSVRQRLLVILATLVLIGFGALALKQIPIDAFPDVTNVQVQVLATAGGMSPPEIEKLVTRPIEIQMAGLPRLEEVRSVSKIGLCAITIVFEDGVSDYFARQLVGERLQGARGNLPTGVDVNLGRSPVAWAKYFNTPSSARTEIRCDGTAHDSGIHRAPDPAHRARRDRREFLRRSGETIPGHHQARPADILQCHARQQVFEALEKNNSNASGNFIEHGSEQYVVRGLGLVKDDERH